MKIKKILTILLCAALMFTAILTLSSCMKEEDYYTKSEVDALIETLKEEYDAKIAELEEKNTANEEKIEDLTEEYDNKINAYCLMDNHVHMVIRIEKEFLSKAMQSLMIRYVQYFNKKYERVGHLFQNRFSAIFFAFAERKFTTFEIALGKSEGVFMQEQF